MYPDPHRIVTDAELWLHWADARSVQDDDTGKSFDQIAEDFYGIRAASCAPLAPAPAGPTSATHQTSVVALSARALLIEGALKRRGADLELYFDPCPDVPLIVEDLLVQAKRLADAGAPSESIDEIFDLIAALRDGRG